MLMYQEAIEIAKEMMAAYPPQEVLNFGEYFAVTFDLGDTPPPGPGVVLVHKENGQARYLAIPPIENLERLEKAPLVWMAD